MSFDFNPNDIAFPNGHFIGGALERQGADELPVRRPSDGVEYARLGVASADTVDRAVVNARQAFDTSDWATGAPRARARILRKWADLIESNAVPLARIEAMGSTRPIKDVLAVRSKGAMSLKGKTGAVEVFELEQTTPPPAP